MPTKWTPERRAAHGVMMKALWATPEHRAKVRAIRALPEVREKTSAANKARWIPEYREKLRLSGAMKQSPERREATAEKQRQLWATSEYRAKMAARPVPDATRMHKPEVWAKIGPATQLPRVEIERTNANEFEMIAKDVLDALDVDYVWQFPVPETGYVADFYIPSRRLLLEIDGKFHLHSKHLRRDQKRDARVRALGYTVVRVQHKAIKRDAQSALSSALAEVVAA